METPSTPLDSADRAFARYCESGNPGDLAQTFEATAPELLRVARHLTPDVATAEDVLQATYLAAIESRERFEAGQPVRPWLCGILENKAKDTARKERRVIHADRLPQRLQASPDGHAEQAELQQAVNTALDQLDGTYRAVLHPYLKSGQTAQAIAEALRRPAGTVRTQIVRGLEKLRQTLPVRLAGALTAWVLPERGLAAVQQAVIAQAKAQAVAATTTLVATTTGTATAKTTVSSTLATAGGLLLMKKLLIPALVGLLAYGTYVFVIQPATPPSDIQGSNSAAAPATVAKDEGVVDGAATTTAVAANPSGREPLTPATDPAPAPTGTLLSGRVVHENGGAMAGVRVVGWNRHHYCIQQDGKYEVPPQFETVTSADGSFTLTGLGEQWAVSASSDATLALVRLQGFSDQRSEIRGVELVMADSTTLRGQLLDADGSPVPDHRFGNYIGGSSSTSDQTDVPRVYRQRPDLHRTTTDAEGRFAIRCIANINYRWQTSHPHYPGWQLVHRASDGPLTVRFERGTTVRGRVYLPGGQPADGAAVTLEDYPDRKATTDAAGRFELRGATLTENSHLRVADSRTAIHITQPMPDDVDDLVVKLAAPRTIHGQVVDEDGRPVFDARIQVVGDRLIERSYNSHELPTWEWAHKVDQTTTNANGEFAIENLYSGRFEVRAFPPGEKRAFVSTTTDSGAGAVVLRLDPAALRKTALMGTVVDATTGAAVPKFTFSVNRVTEDGSMGEVDQGQDGYFERAGIEPGLLYVGITAPGYAISKSPEQQYELGDHHFEFRLHRTTTVTFQVTDGRGLPADATLQFKTLDGQSISIPYPGGSTTGARAHKEKPTLSVSGLPATMLIVEARRAPLAPTRTQIDLTTPRAEPIHLVVRSLPQQVAVLCALVEHDAGWVPPAEFTAEIKPDIVTAFRDGKIGMVKGTATLRLETADGILLSKGTITPAPQEPGDEMPKFNVATGSIHDGQQTGSSSTREDSTIHLTGVAGPMKLFVDVEGYESREMELDGSQLMNRGSRPTMIWFRR